MTTILAFLFVIGIVVFFHEFGHFLMARLEGIKVKEFAIGFGPPVFSKIRKDTIYSFRLLPLGGFVRLYGETPEEKGEGSFLDSSAWSRLKVIAAGPLMNFVLAVLMFFLIFTVRGYPDLATCRIGTVIAGAPAEKAGLKPGDEIVMIGSVKVTRWEELAKIIHASAGKRLKLLVLRDGREITVDVVPEYNPKLKVGLIGITPWVERFNPIGALYYSTKYTLGVSYLMLVAIGRMILRKEKLDIRGPVAVAQLAGQAAKGGWVSLCSFTGLISVNLAFINLFPLPALDGGRLIFILFEIIFRRRLNPKYESTIHYIGFLILITLMILITYHDIVSMR
ncbi:MAG: RIP metalloprotease RseP [Synergistetes bacterium]|nr:RIP metalloprotease RseP [Synergistota bacterium]